MSHSLKSRLLRQPIASRIPSQILNLKHANNPKGGRYAILAAHGEVDAAYACHPSLVAVPGDFDPVTKPLSLAVGDADSLLDNKTVGQIQDLMAKKTELPHELRIYEDQIHGFALRSDWSSEKDRKSMDNAEKQGVDWFNKYLS